MTSTIVKPNPPKAVRRSVRAALRAVKKDWSIPIGDFTEGGVIWINADKRVAQHIYACAYAAGFKAGRRKRK